MDKGKKIVSQSSREGVKMYRADKAKKAKGGKKDYDSMPFKNRDIDRITNPKKGMKNYQDYINGL